jgi:mycoredoxin
MRRWGLAGVVAVLAVLLAAWQLADGSLLLGVVYFLAFGVLAVLVSPRVFPRSVTDASARAASAVDGRPIVYWRPGCPYCLRLRTALGRDAGRLHWVDIWDDPAGAATVRGVTGGDETVPTVVAGDRSWVNPAPGVVRDISGGS